MGQRTEHYWFRVRRLMDDGHYEYLSTESGVWSQFWIDGEAFTSMDAILTREACRHNNTNPKVVYHAVVPCQ